MENAEQTIRFTVNLTKDDFKRGNALFMRKTMPGILKFLWGIMGAWLGIMIVQPIIQPTAVVYAVSITTWVMFIYFVILSVIERAFRTTKVWLTSKVLQSSFGYSMRESGIEADVNGEKIEWKWDQLSKIFESGDYFIICYLSNLYLIIPKREIKDQEENLKKLFTSKMGERFEGHTPLI